MVLYQEILAGGWQQMTQKLVIMLKCHMSFGSDYVFGPSSYSSILLGAGWAMEPQPLVQ